MSVTLIMERERRGEPNIFLLALSLAIGAHVALAWLAPSRDELPEPPPAPLEVDLNSPTHEPPKPEPMPEPPVP